MNVDEILRLGKLRGEPIAALVHVQTFVRRNAYEALAAEVAQLHQDQEAWEALSTDQNTPKRRTSRSSTSSRANRCRTYSWRSNRSFRTEILDAYLLEYLVDVRQISTEWLTDYNLRRPHDSLSRVPPRTFMPRHTAVKV
jgi:hypothetical protein